MFLFGFTWQVYGTEEPANVVVAVALTSFAVLVENGMQLAT